MHVERSNARLQTSRVRVASLLSDRALASVHRVTGPPPPAPRGYRSEYSIVRGHDLDGASPSTGSTFDVHQDQHTSGRALQNKINMGGQGGQGAGDLFWSLRAPHEYILAQPASWSCCRVDKIAGIACEDVRSCHVRVRGLV